MEVITIDTVNDRIAYLIQSTGLTKTAFAARLNISQPFISAVCSGAKVPSDRTLSDICREFGVSPDWLREGTGPMYLQRTANEELAAMCEELLSDPDGSFRRRFVQAFLSFPPDKLDVLREFLEKLAQE